MVGQRAVEADVRRAQAGGDGGVVFGQRQLSLAAADGADVRDLDVDVFRPALVAFDQTVGGFGQKTRFLPDQQHPPVRRDDDEVGLAISREAVFDVAPVDAVADAVRHVFEVDVEMGEGFDFTRGGARDGHLAPA